MHRTYDALLLFGGERHWTLNIDLEMAQARGILELFRIHRDLYPAGRETSGLQILNRVERGAGPQRGEHQLGRRHALVRSGVLPGLITKHDVVTCLDSELHVFQLPDMYLHDCLSYDGAAA